MSRLKVKKNKVHKEPTVWNPDYRFKLESERQARRSKEELELLQYMVDQGEEDVGPDPTLQMLSSLNYDRRKEIASKLKWTVGKLDSVVKRLSVRPELNYG